MIKKPASVKMLALLAFLVTNLIWAAAGPVIKVTLDFIPSHIFLFLRFLVVGIILLPFTIIELKKNPVDKRDYFNLFILGVFSQTAIILIFDGLNYTTALDATIIGVMGPLLSIAAGHYFYKEKVNKAVILGTILAVIGTVFVVIEPIFNGSNSQIDTLHRLWGNILAVAYTLTFLIYVIWSKMSMGERSTLFKKTLSFIHIRPMHQKYSPFILTVTSFYVGLITLVPFALFEQYQTGGFSYASLTLEPILGIIYMAIFSSIVAYFLFQWGLDNSTVKDSAIFSYLQPIMVLPFAYLLLRETPTPVSIIGCLFIALGVIIAESKNS